MNKKTRSGKLFILLLFYLVMIISSLAIAGLVPEPTCYDSDGYNIYTKGYVTWGSYRYEDFCFNSQQIQEYICNGNVAAPVGTVCPAGYSCVNGACVFSTTSTTTSTTTTIPQYCTVYARVFDCNTNQLIGGATINLEGRVQYSSSSGYVTFNNVPVGYRTITASMSGYTSDSRTFYCSCSSSVYVDLRICPIITTTSTTTTSTSTTICCISTTIPTTLPKYCTFRVKVYDDSTTNPLPGALVTLDGGNAQITPSNGIVYYYNVPEGYHTVTGSKSGYNSDSKTAYCSCGRTIDVTLRLYPIITTTTSTTTTSTTTTIPQYCNIEVLVLYDSTNNPLSGALVSLDGTNYRITDSSGLVIYYNIPVGWHSILASKDGFTQDGTRIYCSCSQTHRVTLRLYPIITTTSTTTTSTTSSTTTTSTTSTTTSTTTTSTTTTTTTIPSGKCAGYCGYRSPYGCWCDEKCKQNGDCCDDVCLGCPGLSHCGGSEIYCAITVKVYNDSTNNPLEGVFITLDGSNVKVTGNDGTVTYYGITRGTHNIFATKANFIQATQTFSCETTGHREIVIRMYPYPTTSTTSTTTSTTSSTSTISCPSCSCYNPSQFCDIEVMVYHGDTYNPVAFATVLLDSRTGTTSSSGIAYFYNIPVGSHVIEVSKSGYYSKSQTIYCSCGETRRVTIRLYPIGDPTTNYAIYAEGNGYCHVDVYVIDANTSSLIENAEVKLDGSKKLLTSENGKVEYYLIPSGWRSISVTKEGYYPEYKTFRCIENQRHEIVVRLVKNATAQESEKRVNGVTSLSPGKCRIIAIAIKDYTNETLKNVEITLDGHSKKNITEEGVAIFEDVALGTHTLKAIKEDYYPDIRTAYCSKENETIEVTFRLYPKEEKYKAPTGGIIFQVPEVSTIAMVIILLVLILVAFLLFATPIKRSSEEELPGDFEI